MSRCNLLLFLAAVAMLSGCRETPPAQEATSAKLPSSAPARQYGFVQPVRIALLHDVAECVIAVSGPFDVVDPQDGRVLRSLDSSNPFKVVFASGAIRFPELRCDFEAGAVDIHPRYEGQVAIRRADRLLTYRGDLRLLNRPGSSGAVLNVLEMEDYLPGVVSAEMPPSFETEALRAQAIAARTFAWYQRNYRGFRDWDLNSDESSQAYGGMEAERASPAGAQAARDTCGLVLTWTSPDGEQIFPAKYSSTCGGVTRPAPLRAGDPDWPVLRGNITCEYCAHSPAYRWPTVSFPKKLVSDRLREKYPRIAAIGPIARVEIVGRSPLNRPLTMQVADAGGRSVFIDVEDFRLTVDPAGRRIKSTFNSPVTKKDMILFTDGRGLGHGEGMCQFGADGMARAGRTAVEILQYYYPGCHITRAY